MTLVPFSPRRVPTIWLQFTSTSSPLATFLEAAGGADRIVLTGANPGPAWLLGTLPEGWSHLSHHLDHETPVGRYEGPGGRRVEIRRAAEWFGPGDYSPSDAASAWDALAAILAAVVPGAGLLGSPGATGREAWLRSCPRDGDGRTVTPPVLNRDMAELIRSTSGQHRIELRKPAALEMPGLWVMDGRLMYAAVVRELGTGGRWITGDQASLALAAPGGRYARARYQVRATVPAWWEGQVGILPLAGEDGETWSYPDQPGREFTTWADSAEVFLALDHGWGIEPVSGIMFDKGRPLDTWADRLLRGYGKVNDNEHGTTVARMLRAAFRSMLLHSVGAWASDGGTATTVTSGLMERPGGDGWGVPEETPHGAIWRRRTPIDPSTRAGQMTHPEFSSQIWGRARARVLWAPTAVKGAQAGALSVDSHDLVSIYGDAVMTTRRPGWGTPAHDDGKPGRLRVKGHLCGPLPWPETARQRDALMHRAETNTEPCTCS